MFEIESALVKLESDNPTGEFFLFINSLPNELFLAKTNGICKIKIQREEKKR